MSSATSVLGGAPTYTVAIVCTSREEGWVLAGTGQQGTVVITRLLIVWTPLLFQFSVHRQVLNSDISYLHTESAWYMRNFWNCWETDFTVTDEAGRVGKR